VGGEFGGVEPCGLALGVAVESREEVGFDSAGEFLGSVFGGLDFGPNGGGDGFDGAVEVLFGGGPVVLGCHVGFSASLGCGCPWFDYATGCGRAVGQPSERVRDLAGRDIGECRRPAGAG